MGAFTPPDFQYAAPEQRRPDQSVDSRADIYALGLIINEMFTGHVIQGVDYERINSQDPDNGYLDYVVQLMVQ